MQHSLMTQKEVSINRRMDQRNKVSVNILTLPVGAEEMSVNTTYDENWDATDNEQTPKNPAS